MDFSSPHTPFVRAGGHRLCSRDFNRRGLYFLWGMSHYIKVTLHQSHIISKSHYIKVTLYQSHIISKAVETASTQTKPADAG